MDPTHTTDDLDYMHARHYNLNLARFLSVDPVGGDPLRPQSWNGYSYVLNNPLRFTDPFGLTESGAGDCDDSAAGDSACGSEQDFKKNRARAWLIGQRLGLNLDLDRLAGAIGTAKRTAIAAKRMNSRSLKYAGMAWDSRSKSDKIGVFGIKGLAWISLDVTRQSEGLFGVDFQFIDGAGATFQVPKGFAIFPEKMTEFHLNFGPFTKTIFDESHSPGLVQTPSSVSVGWGAVVIGASYGTDYGFVQREMFSDLLSELNYIFGN
jgi:RHS repeat-associated protein